MKEEIEDKMIDDALEARRIRARVIALHQEIKEEQSEQEAIIVSMPQEDSSFSHMISMADPYLEMVEQETKNREFYEGLLREDPKIIRLFYYKMETQVAKLCRNYNVPQIDAEEISKDAMVLTWENIKNGKYVFQGSNPSTYMYKIAIYKIMEFYRKRGKIIPKELDKSYEELIDDKLERELKKQDERQKIFDKTFPHLDKDCQQIITLVAEKKTDQEIANDPSVPNHNSRVGVNRKKNECRATMKNLLRIAGFFD